MRYDLAMSIGSNESEATPQSKGQAYKNDIRGERQRLTVSKYLRTASQVT
jgi:hypothetical protein